jgi:hypothetical protein
MKKYIISIIGFVIQCFGIGLMLFNINSDTQVYLWIGLPIVFIGLFLILIGLFLNRKPSLK